MKTSIRDWVMPSNHVSEDEKILEALSGNKGYKEDKPRYSFEDAGIIMTGQETVEFLGRADEMDLWFVNVTDKTYPGKWLTYIGHLYELTELDDNSIEVECIDTTTNHYFHEAYERAVAKGLI